MARVVARPQWQPPYLETLGDARTQFVPVDHSPFLKEEFDSISDMLAKLGNATTRFSAQGMADAKEKLRQDVPACGQAVVGMIEAPKEGNSQIGESTRLFASKSAAEATAYWPRGGVHWVAVISETSTGSAR